MKGGGGEKGERRKGRRKKEGFLFSNLNLTSSLSASRALQGRKEEGRGQTAGLFP